MKLKLKQFEINIIREYWLIVIVSVTWSKALIYEVEQTTDGTPTETFQYENNAFNFYTAATPRYFKFYFWYFKIFQLHPYLWIKDWINFRFINGLYLKINVKM